MAEFPGQVEVNEIEVIHHQVIGKTTILSLSPDASQSGPTLRELPESETLAQSPHAETVAFPPLRPQDRFALRTAEASFFGDIWEKIYEQEIAGDLTLLIFRHGYSSSTIV